MAVVGLSGRLYLLRYLKCGVELGSRCSLVMTFSARMKASMMIL